MKKSLLIILFSVLGSLVGTSVASASVYSDTRGESACLFTYHQLLAQGYSPYATYSADQVRNLLMRINVGTRYVSHLLPNEYRLTYSCYEDHYLARPNLRAIPATGKGGFINDIYWTATKPAA